jgi:hypothetical protein
MLRPTATAARWQHMLNPTKLRPTLSLIRALPHCPDSAVDTYKPFARNRPQPTKGHSNQPNVFRELEACIAPPKHALMRKHSNIAGTLQGALPLRQPCCCLFRPHTLSHVPHFKQHAARWPGVDGTHNMKKERRTVNAHTLCDNGPCVCCNSTVPASSFATQRYKPGSRRTAKAAHGRHTDLGCPVGNRCTTSPQLNMCGWTAKQYP